MCSSDQVLEVPRVIRVDGTQRLLLPLGFGWPLCMNCGLTWMTHMAGLGLDGSRLSRRASTSNPRLSCPGTQSCSLCIYPRAEETTTTRVGDGASIDAAIPAIPGT